MIERKSLKYTVLFAILFFPFCVAGTFSYTIPFIYQASIYLKYVFCFFMVILSIKTIQKKDQLPLFLLILVFLIIVLVSTCINRVNLNSYAIYASRVLFFLFYFELASRVHPREMFSAVWLVCFILTAINILSILLYPNGLYTRFDLFTSGKGMAYWFLGNRNLFVDYLFPMLVMSLLLQYITNGKYIRFFISMALSIITIILTGSATTFLVVAILLVYFLLFRRGFLKKIVNPIVWNAFYFFATVIVIVFSNLSFFTYFITNILQRDMTLSYRTIIWRNVMDHIIRNPIIGYGYRAGENFIDNSIVMHAHNLFLHFAYSGGIFAVALLILLIILCTFKIRKVKKMNTVYTMFTFIFFAYLWMEFSEPRIYFPFLFAIVTIIYNIPSIISYRSKVSGKL